MRPDVADVGSAIRRTALNQVHDRASEIRAEFHRDGTKLRHEIPHATVRRGGMCKYHSFAPVQFRPDWGKGLVAQPAVPITGQEADTVGLERVKRILDFAQ